MKDVVPPPFTPVIEHTRYFPNKDCKIGALRASELPVPKRILVLAAKEYPFEEEYH